MSGSWPNDYARWPGYLPFPTPIERSDRPVPNAQSVDWPMAQWAPLFLPAGSPSFQPYRYPPSGPLTQFRPKYRMLPADAFPGAQSGVGPGGDIAQLPFGGVSMPIHARPNSAAPSVHEVVDQLIELPPESVPTESVLPSTAVEVVSEDIPTSAAEAAVTDAIPCFVPIEPELMVGLRPITVRSIQRLETALTKLEGQADLGPAGQRLQDRFTELHERLRSNLEERLERREARRGRRTKAKELLARLRARRAAVKAARGPVTKADRITRIRSAYQQGKITKAQATALTTSTILGARPKVVRKTARRVHQRLG